MKEFYICDCTRHENKIITSNFVVVSKQIKPKKSGEPYLALTLGDRSGQLEAKMWDNVEEVLNAFDQDDFLKVKGLVNKYKNRFQLTVHKLRKLGESEIEFADYLPKTTKNIDELWQTLNDFVASIRSPHLRSVIQAFMADPEIAAAYRNAPAAKTLHHAYIGGLLDHVVSLFRSCDLMCRNYPQIHRDSCSAARSFTMSARSTNSPTTAHFLTPPGASCSATWSSNWKCCTRRSLSSPDFLTNSKRCLSISSLVITASMTSA